jgi:hypothetical protein
MKDFFITCFIIFIFISFLVFCVGNSEITINQYKCLSDYYPDLSCKYLDDNKISQFELNKLKKEIKIYQKNKAINNMKCK